MRGLAAAEAGPRSFAQALLPDQGRSTMRHTVVFSSLAILALGAGMSGSADAVTQSRIIRSQGGTACALSIPTTDTKVRPKAIGFRNEGTAAAFVICGYPLPDGTLTSFNINFMTLDSVNHTVNCTAVDGPPWSPVYSSKSVDTGTDPNFTVTLSWSAADFGGTAGNDLPNGYFSVTCTLPGQALVSNVYVYYNEDVGA
jgi:hypothetical protein